MGIMPIFVVCIKKCQSLSPFFNRAYHSLSISKGQSTSLHTDKQTQYLEGMQITNIKEAKWLFR